MQMSALLHVSPRICPWSLRRCTADVVQPGFYEGPEIPDASVVATPRGGFDRGLRSPGGHGGDGASVTVGPDDEDDESTPCSFRFKTSTVCDHCELRPTALFPPFY